MSKLVPVSEENIDFVLNFVNTKVEKIGTVLPVDKKTFYDYFLGGKTFVVSGKEGIESVFSISKFGGKGVPVLWVRICAASKVALENALTFIKQVALTMESLYIRTATFSYAEECEWLEEAGFTRGAVIPKAACLKGKLYDLLYYYYDLRSLYSFNVERKYVDENLYSLKPVEKRKADVVVRGLRISDLGELEWISNHPNVFTTMGSGYYEGLIWWNRQRIIELITAGKLFSLVAQNAIDGKIIGTISLEPRARRPIGDVLSNVYSMGIIVAAEYQGMGVGTKLIEEMLVLAKRMHARIITLEVFETNTNAVKLYEKFGFVKAGRLPLWLQKGYVWSYMMYKMLS